MHTFVTRFTPKGIVPVGGDQDKGKVVHINIGQSRSRDGANDGLLESSTRLTTCTLVNAVERGVLVYQARRGASLSWPVAYLPLPEGCLIPLGKSQTRQATS